MTLKDLEDDFFLFPEDNTYQTKADKYARLRRERLISQVPPINIRTGGMIEILAGRKESFEITPYCPFRPHNLYIPCVESLVLVTCEPLQIHNVPVNLFAGLGVEISALNGYAGTYNFKFINHSPNTQKFSLTLSGKGLPKK